MILIHTTFFLIFIVCSVMSCASLKNKRLSGEFRVVANSFSSFSNIRVGLMCIVKCNDEMTCRSLSYNLKLKVCQLFQEEANETQVTRDADWVTIVLYDKGMGAKKTTASSISTPSRIATSSPTELPVLSTFTTNGRIGPEGRIQSFVVPYPGCYLIILNGAKGGDGEVNGGNGAVVKFKTCSLTASQQLTIVVGQAGIDAKVKGNGAGGGGGSFVYDNTKSPPLLLAAAGGGGGGCENHYPSINYYHHLGTSYEEGQSPPDIKTGGTNGRGGSHLGEGGAGAGWFSDGESGSNGAPGKSRTNDWTGGNSKKVRSVDASLQTDVDSADGGYGGGGEGYLKSSGAGGGYSGGGASTKEYCAGGGSSYCYPNFTMECDKVSGDNRNANGLVTIQRY